MISGGHLVQLPLLKQLARASCSTPWPETLWVSLRRETSPPPLGSLCQYSVTPAVKMCFLVLGGNLLCFNLWALSLVLSPNTTERAWFPLLCTLSSGICAHWQGVPKPSLLQVEEWQLSLPFLILSSALCWTLSNMSNISLSCTHWRDQKWNQDSRCSLSSAE